MRLYPGVKVLIESLERGAITDELGIFRIVDVPEGEYELEVSLLPKGAVVRNHLYATHYDGSMQGCAMITFALSTRTT